MEEKDRPTSFTTKTKPTTPLQALSDIGEGLADIAQAIRALARAVKGEKENGR